MPFCTIVEFEWDETFDFQRFADLTGNAGAGHTPPEGCLSRIAGIDGTGARVVEVWRSSDDAKAFAESSAPALAAARLPPPSRVSAFETTAYVVAS